MGWLLKIPAIKAVCDQWISEKALAKRWHINVDTLAIWRSRDQMLPHLWLFGFIVYLVEDVEKFEENGMRLDDEGIVW